MALYDEAVRQRTDYVPGVMFSVSGRYRNCLRLNGGYPVTAATEQAIRRLGKLFSRR
jgi:DNA-binding transcriptional MocR family regulator